MQRVPTKTTRMHVPTILSALFLLGVWYFVTEQTTLISSLFLPSPLAIVTAFYSLVANALVVDILVTVARVMVAFFFSVVFALPVALLMSESIFWKRLLTPYIDFIRYLPVPALIPLTILFFGIGESAKIILLFVGTFFQIVLLFDADLMNVPKEYFDLAYSLRFTTSERIWMKLRAAAPGMYDNMRISLALDWSYVVIAELIAAQTGIGHMIKEAQRFSLTSHVYVGIFLMGAIGFFSDYLFRKGRIMLFPYKKDYVGS